MKTIGLLGGMSWESTTSYYKFINTGVKQALGGLHSAKIAMYSVDFAEIEQLQMAADWQGAADVLSQAAKGVEAAGADFIMICTNTMHKVAPEIERSVGIPLLHIADATAAQLRDDGINKVGLLGTRFTMEQPFYRERLEEGYGIEVIVPEQGERDLVHTVIYQELCQGIIRDSSRQQYLQIINGLAGRGAQAVILGCTEIALLIQPTDTDLPVYDTTEIHCQAALARALQD